MACMRTEPLAKEEKQQLTDLLARLRLLPPVAGSIVLNLDVNQKVSSVELQKAVWR